MTRGIFGKFFLIHFRNSLYYKFKCNNNNFLNLKSKNNFLHKKHNYHNLDNLNNFQHIFHMNWRTYQGNIFQDISKRKYFIHNN
jgi:hypothetical protein